MDKKKFCMKLKKARLEASLKQEDVAKYMGLPISAISVMESGARRVDVFELAKLADCYKKPVEWFFHEHIENHPRRRWYDLDPILSESVELLRKAPTRLQRSAASGVIGFLGEDEPQDLNNPQE